ncbi:MAG: hypothetical protein L0191_07355, partial [Acidobacteria bacterium]|nr:hypothetical protein [Acidobacteriota bacterium]
LTFEDRVAAQKAIEEVLWVHRIWPRDNPNPKPPLSAVISDASIREKVSDSLKKSAALEKLWKHPIRPDQLQEEIARISRSSHQPEILREILGALGNDPDLIAESVARPALADRLLRNAYSGDRRFQGEVQERARRDLEKFPTPDRWKESGGRYLETTWRRFHGLGQPKGGDVNLLSPSEYDALISEIAKRTSSAAPGLPAASPPAAGRVGALSEDEETLSVTTVLQQDDNSIKVATLVWDKAPFDAWWRKTRTSMSDRLEAPDHVYDPVQVQSGSCTNDVWRATGSARPDGRYYHMQVWTGTEMIVWGGRIAGNGQTSSGGRYNPALDLWTPMFNDRNPAHVPDPREKASMVWTGSRVIVWGGNSNLGGSRRDGGIYDPGTDTWDLDMGATETEPQAKSWATTVWTGTEMIAWGGLGASGSPTGTGWRFNPATRTWTATSMGPGAPGARNA